MEQNKKTIRTEEGWEIGEGDDQNYWIVNEDYNIIHSSDFEIAKFLPLKYFGAHYNAEKWVARNKPQMISVDNEINKFFLHILNPDNGNLIKQLSDRYELYKKSKTPELQANSVYTEAPDKERFWNESTVLEFLDYAQKFKKEYHPKCWIESFKKSKLPSTGQYLPELKTTDGIYIYKGQTIWVVFTKDGFRFPTGQVTQWDDYSKTNWDESVKTFSSKEKAQEYLLYSSSLLSLNDLLSILGNGQYKQDYPVFKRALELAELRQNNKQ